MFSKQYLSNVIGLLQFIEKTTLALAMLTHGLAWQLYFWIETVPHKSFILGEVISLFIL